MISSGLTLNQVKARIRKKYSFFESPKKSDRLFLTEDHWQRMDWTDKEKFINAALPHKLWNMRHDDHPWPFSRRYRGADAIGWRAGMDHVKFADKLPELVKGRGIARWMSEGDKSILEIDLFKDYKNIWTPENIPNKVEAVERQAGAKFGEKYNITKEDLFYYYAPSSLQKFSKKSKLLRDPYHYSWHRMIKKREKYHGDYEPDTVAFYRFGARWDSGDGYFIKNAFYIGGRWN